MYNRKRGFTLIELILVISVGLVMTTLSFQQMLKEDENTQSKAVGQQIKQIGNSVNSYIALHYDKLSLLQNADGSTQDPGPRSCDSYKNECPISIQTLINEGLLPATYSNKNLFNSTYSILLKRSGSAPYYNITGLVITEDVWKGAANRIRYDLIGKAMQEAGVDSGMSRNNVNTINGYKGMWDQNSSTFSNIKKQGQLAYQVGYGSYSYSIYLRRDGTLPMTGNLNMGSQSINNVKDINGNGNLTMAGIGKFGGEVGAQNGYGDRIWFGGDAFGDDYEIRLDTNKKLSIYSPNAPQHATVLSVNQNTVIGSRLATNGMDPNELPAGWIGGIRTQDIYAGGVIAAGNSRNVSTYMDNSGNMYASNNVTTNTLNANYIQSSGNIQASGDINSNRVIANYIQSNGDSYTNGNSSVNGALYSNYIQSNGRISINEYLELRGTVTEGYGCDPSGMQSKDSSGALLSCVNGVWTYPMNGVKKYQNLGVYKGGYATTNNTGKPIKIYAYGGNPPPKKIRYDGADDCVNTYTLKATVNGLTVAVLTNANSTWNKSASINFDVPKNASYTITSDGMLEYGCDYGNFTVLRYD